MANVQDFAHFKTFGGNLHKKQLQNFYKSAQFKALAKGTPVFLQGTPGNQYFIVLKGTIKISKASDKRQREIVTALVPHVLKSAATFSDGFLGRPMHSFSVSPGEPGIGFGGVQMMGGERSERGLRGQ